MEEANCCPRFCFLVIEIEAVLSRGSSPSVVEVDEGGIVEAGGQRLANLGGRLNTIDAVALRMQQQLKCFQDVLLVVGRQNTRGAVLVRIGRYQRMEVLRLGRSRHAR